MMALAPLSAWFAGSPPATAQGGQRTRIQPANPPLRLRPILSTHLRQVLALLDDSLSLNGRSATFDRDTPLLGALPELDSMAVATLLTTIEENFGVSIGDDEVDGSIFATVGSLADFIESKLG